MEMGHSNRLPFQPLFKMTVMIHFAFKYKPNFCQKSHENATGNFSFKNYYDQTNDLQAINRQFPSFNNFAL